MQLSFLIFASIVVNVIGVEFPAYIKRCAINDPNISQCIEDHGNLAIPQVVKGIESLGIPVLSPFRVSELQLYAKNFRLLLTNVIFDNFKDARLHNVKFDLQHNSSTFDLRTKFLNFTSQYSIEDGQVLTQNISGKGKFHMSLTDNVLKFNLSLSQYVKDGKTHLDISHVDCKLISERALYDFENIRRSSAKPGDDINLFIQQNWASIMEKTTPGVEQFLLKYYLLVIKTMIRNFPINEMFL
ncbi:hypothetical protein Trydic_g19571 [Trypoxylus dichotomus]